MATLHTSVAARLAHSGSLNLAEQLNLETINHTRAATSDTSHASASVGITSSWSTLGLGLGLRIQSTSRQTPL
jgi:hypothetical protein